MLEFKILCSWKTFPNTTYFKVKSGAENIPTAADQAFGMHNAESDNQKLARTHTYTHARRHTCTHKWTLNDTVVCWHLISHFFVMPTLAIHTLHRFGACGKFWVTNTVCRTRAIFLYWLGGSAAWGYNACVQALDHKYKVPGRLLTLQNVYSVLLIYSGPYLSVFKVKSRSKKFPLFFLKARLEHCKCRLNGKKPPAYYLGGSNSGCVV